MNPLLDDVSWIGQKVIVSGWGDLDEKKPPSKPDILQYANLEIWEPNVCFLRWFDAEPDTARPSNWKEQMKKGSTINPKFTKMHIEIQNGPSNLKTVQAKNLVKSKKSFFFSREIAFLAILNIFPIQKLIFGHF